jgi:hypothetical protein
VYCFCFWISVCGQIIDRSNVNAAQLINHCHNPLEKRIMNASLMEEGCTEILETRGN